MHKTSFFSSHTAAPVSMSFVIALALAMVTTANAQYTSHDGAGKRHVVARHGTASVAPPAGQSHNHQGGTHGTAGTSGYQYGQARPTTPGSTQTPQPVSSSANNPHVTRYGAAGIAPVAGSSRSSVVPSVGQSRSNVGSRAPAKATGKPGYQYGQTGPTTITGPNGQKVTLGGTQTIKGVNGKQISVGGASPLKGAHGQSYSAGVTTGPQRNAGGVNAQGDHQGGIHLDNGGVAGESDSLSEDIQEYQGPFSGDGNGTTTSDHGSLQFKNHKKWSGTDSDGLTWENGRPMNGPAEGGGQWVNGHHIKGMGNTDSGVGDDPDIGSQGGGTLVSGTGKGINPGHRGGQDGGTGPGEGGAPTGGGSNRNNATGAYVMTNKNGQDIPVKPKPTGPMTNSYNGIKGVTDPKRGAGAGGG